MHIGDYIGHRAALSPDRVAVVDTALDQRFSYGELDKRACALATWLARELGVGKGDRVAVLAADGVAHLDALFAASKLGAVHTPLSWRLHGDELAPIVRALAPRVLIHDAEREALARTIAGGASRLPLTGTSGLFELVAREVDGPAAVALDEADPAVLLLSGGTTGTPRAAVISHRMLAYNAFGAALCDLQQDDVYLNSFPLFHTGGLLVYTLPLLILGGTVVLAPRFDPAETFAVIARERPTIFGGVPTVYQRLAASDGWPDADLGSLRFCNCGGAPLPVALVERFWADHQVRLKQGFGMTECGPVMFSLDPEQAVSKAGSIGRPTFFVDVTIHDPSGSEVGVDEVGELVARGPVLSNGYFTRGAPPAAIVDDQGWFHTGDLVRRDADGLFWVVGRKKEMFISGGENVYPTEVEDVLARHPDVELCAVVAIADEQWGQSGLACVTLREGAGASAEELLEWLRERIASYKVPRKIEITADMPLSGPGKILKRELRNRLGLGE